MSCVACGFEAPPMAELTPSGFLLKCAACGVPLAEQPAAEDPQAPKARRVSAPVAEVAPPVAAKAPSVVKAAPVAPKTIAITPAVIIREARRERRALEKSIAAHRRAMTREQKKLDEIARLLDAADARPRAVVRAIRTTA